MKTDHVWSWWRQAWSEDGEDRTLSEASEDRPGLKPVKTDLVWSQWRQTWSEASERQTWSEAGEDRPCLKPVKTHCLATRLICVLFRLIRQELLKREDRVLYPGLVQSYNQQESLFRPQLKPGKLSSMHMYFSTCTLSWGLMFHQQLTSHTEHTPQLEVSPERLEKSGI